MVTQRLRSNRRGSASPFGVSLLAIGMGGWLAACGPPQKTDTASSGESSASRPSPAAEILQRSPPSITCSIHWSDGDLAHSARLLRALGGQRLTATATLADRNPPRFYVGELPLRFDSTVIVNSAETVNPSVEVTVVHDFGAWRNLFLYLDATAASLGIPNGAQAVEAQSGRVLAEARLIRKLEKSAQGDYRFPIEECHYDANGVVVFKSISQFPYGTSMKVAETEAIGHKVRDYFYLYPTR